MDLQVAISHAIEFARKALPNEKLSVEVVEHDDSPPASWRITLGYKRALPEKRPLMPLGAYASIADRLQPAPKYTEYEDVYKTIIVPENGSNLSMKIRKV